MTELQASAEQSDRLHVAIIAGSTRPRRKAHNVARWLHEHAAERQDASFEVVDIADYNLPLLDEPTPPIAGPLQPAAHQTLGAEDRLLRRIHLRHSRVQPLDLGRAQERDRYLHAEWNDKAAAFVGYGIDGATRAIEHLRLILAEVKVADVRTPVTLRFGEDFAGYNEPTPRDSQQQAVQAMLDDLLSWGQALAALRDQDEPTTERAA